MSRDQTVQTSGSVFHIFQCTADAFETPLDAFFRLIVKQALQHRQYGIQGGHDVFRLVFQGLNLPVDLLEQAQLQMCTECIPALRILQGIPRLDIYRLGSHQVAVLNGGNGVGRNLESLFNGKLHQYALETRSHETDVIDLSDMIAPVYDTARHFQTVHLLIDTVKNIVPVKQGAGL